jgi:cysteine synthase
MLLEEDVDHLEGVAKESAARVTRLLVAAAGLLVSVSTAIIVLFVTGAVGK